MAEEKKDANQEAQAAAQPQTPPAQPQAQAATPDAPQQAPKKEEKKEAVKKEKPTNCVVCNKSIKKKRSYYRNGKQYCTKRCWKTTLKQEEKKEEAPAQQ